MAVSGVNPSGVNVNANGVTTVFLTFQNLGLNEQALESFWCGQVTTTAVTNFDPCVPGTLFGRLPARNNLARPSGTGGVSNLTDIMTIPASVARRAYQQAEAGGPADFFYVRRFSDGVNNTYVVVTCRMAGGGARVPLALTRVSVAFNADEGARPISFFDREQTLPLFGASIEYNGGGQLRGRWEIQRPGDVEPTPLDLLTEASLPVELRGTQQRYSLVERFNVFLPPTGKFYLPGPKPSKISFGSDGPYKILLRIEASNDKEGNSNTLDGVVSAGGVAGFPMPVLQFSVGSGESQAAAQDVAETNGLALLTPQSSAVLASDAPLLFSWMKQTDDTLFRLEVRTDNGDELFSAILLEGRYEAPSWALTQDQQLHWRVSAIDANGATTRQSEWRRFEVRVAASSAEPP
jgi:hypothetical protein